MSTLLAGRLTQSDTAQFLTTSCSFGAYEISMFFASTYTIVYRSRSDQPLRAFAASIIGRSGERPLHDAQYRVLHGSQSQAGQQGIQRVFFQWFRQAGWHGAAVGERYGYTASPV
jgi:hypothetical protein